MYALGVSTRKVGKVLERMGADRLSKDAVSRICAALDAEVAKLRSRQLPPMRFPYLWVDATYVPCRRNGHGATAAVVTAIAVGEDGVRRVESPPFPLTLVLPFRHDVPNGERREGWDTRHPSTPPSSSSGRRGSTASAAARAPSSPASSAATPAAYRTGSGGRTPRGPPPTGTPSGWPRSRAGRGARTTVSGPRTRYF